MYLEESIKSINAKLACLGSRKHIIIWGASENTVRLFQYTNISQYSIKGFVDNGRAGVTFFGEVVRLPKDVDWNAVDAVVISSFYHENEIENELINRYGFTKEIVKLNCERQESPFYEHISSRSIDVPEKYRNITAKNRKYKNIHEGERLFLLGTAPSINQIDLCKLADERTMVVSNFYMHKDYSIIKPDYYCFAQFTYTDILNDQFYLQWIREIAEHSGSPQFFFNITEKRLIEKCDSFSDKDVNYVFLEGLNSYYEDIDLTKKIRMGNSVPIDCLQIAIYMGFQEIYLLGIEHSIILSGNYNYFYHRKDNMVGDKDPHHGKNGEATRTFGEMLPGTYILWEQYKQLKRIAEKQNIKIFNANPEGLLDVFEKVNYNQLF